jgi:hypothetical protein
MISKTFARTVLQFSLLLITTTISIAQIPQRPSGPKLEHPLARRPNSPKDLRLIKRGADFLRIGFTDSSDNELGNRLYRSVDGVHWDLLRELGILSVGRKFEYTDLNLARTSLYYYKVEVYARPTPLSRRDSIVKSFTPKLAAYTGEGDSVRLFRLQIFLKTANLPGAEMDGPLRVDIGINRGWAFPVKEGKYLVPESDYTFLDYGHDDSQRDSEFSYDLITKDIHNLAQLGDIKISNTTWNDSYILETVKIIANNNVVYERQYGAAGHTIVGLGRLIIPFSDMASSTTWKNLVIANRSPLYPPGLDVTIDRTTASWTIKIPKAELVSRIESSIGHSLTDNPFMRDNLKWDIGNHAVTASYKKPDTLRVDLDLTITSGPNRNLDVDFELGISKTCDQNNRLKFVITPVNFRSDPHFDWFNGLLPGLNFILKIGFGIVADSQGNRDYDAIESTFDLPSGYSCTNSKCMFNPEGDLLIILNL